MKQLPNILTLANLFFGCMAIAFLLSAPSYLNTVNNTDYYPIIGVEDMFRGSIFIGLAAVMDMLDGLAARALNSESKIGRDLDSLADVVSFGVAPSMILFKLLWMAYMQEPGALEAPMIAMAPAFLLACFAALRLAKFNHTADEQKAAFIGMPTPAIGLVTASFPLILFYNYDTAGYLLNRWVIYILIALLCWLMHSRIRFFKWKASGSAANWWPHIVLVLVMIIGAVLIQFAIVPIAFALYIILSIIYKPRTL